MGYRLFVPVLLCLVGAPEAPALDAALARDAAAALRKSVGYLRTEVAYGGGYLGSYLEDLSDQWGEDHATRTQNWIQPPGSPSVGFAFLRAYEATGDSYYLEGAKEVADALVFGQLECGGWDYIVDHAPSGATVWYYRRNAGSADPKLKSGRNTGTFDDNTTQHAVRLLIAVDLALEQQDAPIHDAATVALEYMLRAQHESGGWPQIYPLRGRGYNDFFTFNDNTIRDCVDVMMIAYRAYGDERYAEAVRRCGEFILRTQLPEPQAIWAQQYDLDLRPAWARRFEPPAACAGESRGVLGILMEIALFTGDERYLEPIPRALDWYRRSALPDGKYARFYELKTNRPLYMTSDNRTSYWLTYDDGDLPDHYSFKGQSYPQSEERRYRAIVEQGLAAYREATAPRPLTAEQRRAAAEALEDRVRQILAAMDERGRWVDVRGGRRMIELETFERHIGTLAAYLKLVNDR